MKKIPIDLQEIMSAPFGSQQTLDDYFALFGGPGDVEYFYLLHSLLKRQVQARGELLVAESKETFLSQGQENRLKELMARARELQTMVSITPTEPAFGSIWTIKQDIHFEGKNISLNTAPYVVITSDQEYKPAVSIFSDHYRTLQVIPVSIHIKYTAENDIILPENEFHPSIMLESWNKQDMLLSSLHKCAGTLADVEKSWLTHPGKVPKNLCGETITNRADPRLLFRQAESFSTAFLSISARAPVLALAASSIDTESKLRIRVVSLSRETSMLADCVLPLHFHPEKDSIVWGIWELIENKRLNPSTPVSLREIKDKSIIAIGKIMEDGRTIEIKSPLKVPEDSFNWNEKNWYLTVQDEDR